MQRIFLTEIQKKLLTQIVHANTTPQRFVLRCGIILDYAAQYNQSVIARKRGIDRNTVHHWLIRWEKARASLDKMEESYNAGSLNQYTYSRAITSALADAPRPGAPVTFTQEQKQQIRALASEKPEKTGAPVTHWTHKILAKFVRDKGIVTTISSAHLGRFLKEGDITTTQE